MRRPITFANITAITIILLICLFMFPAIVWFSINNPEWDSTTLPYEPVEQVIHYRTKVKVVTQTVIKVVYPEQQ